MANKVRSGGHISGAWSKYGGAIRGVEKESIQDEWFCQACAEKQPKDLPPFMFEFFPREYIRICGKCHNKVKILNLINFNELKRVVEHKTIIITKTFTRFN